MRRFRNLGDFITFMERQAAEVPGAVQAGLKRAAEIVEAEAKASIGHYQDAAGPFPAWEPLAPGTLGGFHDERAGYIPGKEELGYAPPDNPLLRAGSLRDSYSHFVEPGRAVIGSSDPVALWQELGTPDARRPIPPRSVLGGALVRKTDEAITAIAARVAAVLAGKGT